MPIFGKKNKDMSEEELFKKGSKEFEAHNWEKSSEYLGILVMIMVHK